MRISFSGRTLACQARSGSSILPIRTKLMEEHRVNISQKTFIFRDDGTFLTLLRTKTAPTRPLTWDLPGGVYEYGEDAEESARREIREETSLEVGKLIPITIESEVHKDGVCVVSIAYKTILRSGKVTLSYEHGEHQWVTPQEFLKLKSSPKWERIAREKLL